MTECHCISNVVTKKHTGWRIGHKAHSVVSLRVRRKAAVDWNVSIIDLTLLKHDAQICRKFYCFGFLHVEYRQVSFYAILSQKTLCKLKSHTSNTKFPFKTVYFLGVRGLTASSYIVYDYTTSGHTDL